MTLQRRMARLYAWMVNDKRQYPAYSYRWLNQRSGSMFWQNSGALIRPQYAWGVWMASAQARALGHSEIAAIEFGVAGGRGLIVLQDIAHEVSALTRVKLRLYGFDTGSGLPPITDPRDLPQLYRPGDYRMTFDTLKKRLKPGTELVLGDIRQTIDEFLASSHPPVGFISFDMDLYTATRLAQIVSGRLSAGTMPAEGGLLSRRHCGSHVRRSERRALSDERIQSGARAFAGPFAGVWTTLSGRLAA
jgi:hypothetical protein